ncbi:hypothetical protein PGT21_035012 [Puccinia graminis f. sp. tritici]|uniref:Uncharacterized protein n=1 Tax=Puccinia graminis f. sp. tritici TaxID=56615 RepID=A0A5B0NEA0_PUCGR|nr:hypothetical protein PGT21_035012 [Puccinia graminis f. sp. tritici]
MIPASLCLCPGTDSAVNGNGNGPPEVQYPRGESANSPSLGELAVDGGSSNSRKTGSRASVLPALP